MNDHSTHQVLPAANAINMMRRMADLVERNADNGFAGAFVIVPPEGDPKELLVLDNTQDATSFWTLLQTRAQIALSELQEQQNSGWGNRR